VHGIIDRFYDALTPGGYLVLGHTESTAYVSRKFPDVISHRTLVYRKSPSYRHAASAAPGEIKPTPPGKPMLHMPGQPAPTTPAGSTAAAKLPAFTKTPAATMPTARPSPIAPAASAGPTVEAAAALWQAGDYAGAERMVEVLAARPDAPSAVWTLYGRIRADQGQNDDARIKLRRALGIDSCDVEAHYLMSFVHREVGEFDEAIKELKQVIYLDDRMALAQYDLGNIYADRGDKQKARRHWELARDILARAAETTPLELRNDFPKGRLLGLLQHCLK
jgi:chemotaxis protein methyltransferase CheR